MIISETKIQVLYADTDKMGYVYYGNFAKYYEHARTDALKKLGLSYKELEANGYGMPVLSLNIKYFKPAFYDDVLTVKTFIKEMPNRKIIFYYETYNENGILLNEASTELILVNIETKKPATPPQWFNELFLTHFKLECTLQ